MHAYKYFHDVDVDVNFFRDRAADAFLASTVEIRLCPQFVEY
jgi:hypothetical protein